MKKIFAVCAALLVSGFAANQASAQAPVMGMPAGPGEFAPSPYGWHPKFQNFIHAHGSDKCGRPNLLGKIFGKERGGPAPDVANSGTLVFPQNPFTRSPRDFFMMDR